MARTPFSSATEGTPQNLKDLILSINVHIEENTKYVRFKKLYANDRVAFIYDCMPSLAKTIAPYQVETVSYYDEGATRVAIRGPHGLGKTAIASVLVHHTVLTVEEDAKVPTTASAWRQLEKYLWPEIHKSAKLIDWATVGRAPYSSDEMLVRSIKTDNAEAFALASDDHTSLEGAHATHIFFIFDEAKTIAVPTWDALEGAFSTEGLSETHKAMALAISTPGDPSGRFYDIHMQAPGYDDWRIRHVTIDEAIAAGRVSGAWVEQRRRQWGEDSVVFQNRVLGQFADNSEDGVIPLSWIQHAVDRWHAWKDTGDSLPDGPRTMGVDVARSGNDATVLALREALTITSLLEYRKNRTTVTAGHITQNMADRQVTIEGDALGSSVYDILREQGVRNVRTVIPGGKTTFRDRSGKLTFLNNRSAMWWNMRELLDPANGMDVMLPNHPKLIGDLSAPKWQPNSRGVIQVEGKADIAKRIGRSTDFGDAVCYAFFPGSAGGGIVF